MFNSLFKSSIWCLLLHSSFNVVSMDLQSCPPSERQKLHSCLEQIEHIIHPPSPSDAYFNGERYRKVLLPKQIKNLKELLDNNSINYPEEITFNFIDELRKKLNELKNKRLY